MDILLKTIFKILNGMLIFTSLKSDSSDDHCKWVVGFNQKTKRWKVIDPKKLKIQKLRHSKVYRFLFGFNAFLFN